MDYVHSRGDGECRQAHSITLGAMLASVAFNSVLKLWGYGTLEGWPVDYVHFRQGKGYCRKAHLMSWGAKLLELF